MEQNEKVATNSTEALTQTQNRDAADMKAYLQFIDKRSKIIAAWLVRNPQAELPIVPDGNGGYIWLNRKARRS